MFLKCRIMVLSSQKNSFFLRSMPQRRVLKVFVLLFTKSNMKISQNNVGIRIKY